VKHGLEDMEVLKDVIGLLSVVVVVEIIGFVGEVVLSEDSFDGVVKEVFLDEFLGNGGVRSQRCKLEVLSQPGSSFMSAVLEN
jgi:hypothetical protein